MSIDAIANDLGRCLGGFWADVYGDRDQVAQLLEGVAVAANNEQAALGDWTSLLAAATATPAAIVPRYSWTVRLGERDPVKYTHQLGDSTLGGDDVLGDQTTTNVLYPKPDGLIHAPLLVDGPRRPTFALIAGLDYVVNGDRVQFRVDPMTDPRLAAARAGRDEVDLVFVNARFDRRRLDCHYGWVLGCVHADGPNYQRFLAAVWKGLAEGVTPTVIDAALSALMDAPRAENDGEVVRDVVEWTGRPTLIITDQNCYSVVGAAAVVVGDVLKRGRWLGHAVRRDQLGNGPPPGLRLLALGAADTGRDELTVWSDRFVPTRVGEDHDGRTVIEWDLDAGGVDYWSAVDRAALAVSLDLRGPNPPSPPSALTLPTEVNPLDLLCREALIGVDCVQLRVDDAGPGMLRLDLLGRLLDLLPPQCRILVVIHTARLGGSAVAAAADSPRCLATPKTRLGDAAVGGDALVRSPRYRAS